MLGWFATFCILPFRIRRGMVKPIETWWFITFVFVVGFTGIGCVRCFSLSSSIFLLYYFPWKIDLNHLCKLLLKDSGMSHMRPHTQQKTMHISQIFSNSDWAIVGCIFLSIRKDWSIDLMNFIISFHLHFCHFISTMMYIWQTNIALSGISCTDFFLNPYILPIYWPGTVQVEGQK